MPRKSLVARTETCSSISGTLTSDDKHQTVAVARRVFRWRASEELIGRDSGRRGQQERYAKKICRGMATARALCLTCERDVLTGFVSKRRSDMRKCKPMHVCGRLRSVVLCLSDPAHASFSHSLFVAVRERRDSVSTPKAEPGTAIHEGSDRRTCRANWLDRRGKNGEFARVMSDAFPTDKRCFESY